MSAGRKLVIVESPAKARTIAGYLGEGYDVEASVGHIRDLPQPSELPADMKKGPFGKFAVDVDNGFAPYYVVDSDKKKKVSELKKLLKESDELFLATDEDREGEAIAWHLLQELKPKVPVKRMVFHEITPRGHPAGARQHPRARRPAGRRAGDPAHPRPALRLRGQPGAVAQGPPGPVRRSRAVRRHAAGGRARARAHGVRRRRLLGRHRHVRRRGRGRAVVQRPPDVGRRAARGHRPRLPGHRAAAGRRRRPPRRGPRDRAGGRPGRRRVLRLLARDQAVHAPPGRAVHHLDPAAGGVAQAADGVAADHAHRAGAVRERLHHLHAYGLVVAERAGDRRRAPAGVRAVRRRVHPGRAPRLHQQGQGRAGGARGHPPRRRPLPDPRAGGQGAVGRPVPALRADLEAHRRLADGRRPRADRVGPPRRDRRRRHRRRCSPPPAPSSRSAGSSRRTRRVATSRGTPRTPTAPAPRRTTPACPRWPRATRCPRPTSPPTGTARPRRRASPRPRWSRRSRSAGSAARRPTPRRSPSSRTAGT